MIRASLRAETVPAFSSGGPVRVEFDAVVAIKLLFAAIGSAGGGRVLATMWRRRVHRREEAKKALERELAERDQTRKMVAELHKRIMPNGGSSLDDKVSRMHDDVREIRRAVRQAGVRSNVSSEMLAIGHVKADAQGRWIEVDSTVQKMIRRGRDELLGRGWLSAVCRGDRERVTRIWDRHMMDQSPMHQIFAFKEPDGTIVPVEFRAAAINGEDLKTVESWHIVMRKVERAIYDGDQGLPEDEQC